ncbi:MAG: Rpn family recombination-promoting nuclease/putative transposase [Bacteroidales bacterium]|nr:Rpn family recombination-promoting nuclease/putative transposase [Bacteroidales bacterium]
MKTYENRAGIWPEDMLRYKEIIDSKPNLAGISEEEKLRLAKHILSSTYADITDNWAFKWVFGNNPDLLIMLLHDLLEEDIVDITYLPTDSLAGTEGDKQAAMDVSCRTSDGRQFVVEMQTSRKRDFRNRLVYYGSSVIHRQVKTGDPGYKYDDVRVIAILDYGHRHAKNTPKEKVLFHYRLKEDETGELYGNQMSVYMLELGRMKRKESETKNEVEEWCYIFRNISKFAGIPENVNPKFYKLMETIRMNKMSDSDKANYLGSSLSDYEREDIAAANFEYGREEGFDAGLEQGRVEILRKFLDKGFSIEDIADITGISAEEIALL